MNYKLFLFLFLLVSKLYAFDKHDSYLDISIVMSNQVQYIRLDCNLKSNDTKHYYLQASEDLKVWTNFVYLGLCSKDKTITCYDKKDRVQRFYRIFKEKNKNDQNNEGEGEMERCCGRSSYDCWNGRGNERTERCLEKKNAPLRAQSYKKNGFQLEMDWLEILGIIFDL